MFSMKFGRIPFEVKFRYIFIIIGKKKNDFDSHFTVLKFVNRFTEFAECSTIFAKI